ncbi:DUF4124 domain-containing protein [Solimonas terrae]|uniref:DUF4124 domain-containing protein n=1 Tax=Solimonas terrae TaxID=1396819 RepID=A0A6M2BRS1_9GAMM|nr:DUF4124 domain-containing protein [Solimonas terrae]NGY04793.1 DUF4124 domain-containing protein [Solimonas terrae]
MKGALSLLLCLFAGAAVADDAVYRYTDANGVVHYSDRAPDRHAKPIRLGPLATSTPTRHAMFYSPEVLRAAARFAVRVESPTPDQRIEAGRAPLVAAASVMPALVQGFHLVYQVDGHAVTSGPVDALSIQLPSLAAGSHALQIVLLDEHGAEVARSTPANFQIAGTRLASGAPKQP